MREVLDRLERAGKIVQETLDSLYLKDEGFAVIAARVHLRDVQRKLSSARFVLAEGEEKTCEKS